MSSEKQQPPKKQQSDDLYGEKNRQEQTGREDPTDPEDVGRPPNDAGRAENPETVRGHHTSQHVRG